MLEPAKKRRSLTQCSAWLALLALVIQFTLPLAHFCSLDAENHFHDSDRAVASSADILPAGQSILHAAKPLSAPSEHDQSTCPICRSLLRPGTAEMSAAYAWTGAWLTVSRFVPFHLVSVFQQPEWSTSSPRGPPRNS